MMKWINFFAEIDNTCSETNSQFCLAIVDKKLSTGAHDEEGKDFIINEIIPRNKQRNKKIICCLYTSQPNILTPLNTYDDYFVQEIGKTSVDKINKIAKTLARSAYAQVFNTINIKYQKSAAESLGIVLKNQSNIKYIIQQSHAEGIPAYESIKYWFDIAHQKTFESLELKDFKFIASLTSFFNQEYLDDHFQIAEIGEELKALNAFELFDLNVNEKHLPIAPGDIWKAGDEYFILIGQLCDIMLRQKENKRNARIGELIRVELIEYRDSGKKYDTDQKDGKKFILIENFYIAPLNVYRTLKIEVSTPNTFFADLKVLDLAMFNSEGICQINVDQELDDQVKQILPLNKDSYFNCLKDEYKSRLELSKKLDLKSQTILSSPIDISIGDFLEENEYLTHGIRRIGRLKGRYFDSLYNSYINNKSRIDLNLIDNSIETARNVKLNYRLLGQSQFETVDIKVWMKRGKEYIKKEELEHLLNGQFPELIKLYDKEISFNDANRYELTKQDETLYQLELFPYLSDPKRFHNKENINYSHLFNGKSSNKYFTFLDNGEQGMFFDDAGNKVSFPLQLLQRGFIVHEKKKIVKLQNGIIKFNDLEQ